VRHIVVLGFAHNVTQRGNKRQNMFRACVDGRVQRELPGTQADRDEVTVLTPYPAARERPARRRPLYAQRLPSATLRRVSRMH
ncbi:MAG: hypothetical protein ACYSUI_12925, partial [Planctomycetota bacterium]|jgi:hypothetical protein